VARKSRGCPLCNPDYIIPKAMKKSMDGGSIFAFTCDVSGEVGYLFNKSMYTDHDVLVALGRAFRNDVLAPQKEYRN
jgi:hypothetical protein